MFRSNKIKLILSLFTSLNVLSCSSGGGSLARFTDSQRSKVIQGSAFLQADFEFWGAYYVPTVEDLNQLKTAWIEHGEAFPESKFYSELSRELNRKDQTVIIVSLFMTAYENADLRNASMGWTVYPVPTKITEIEDSDLVLKALMPLKNAWARYFMLRYPPTIWDGKRLVISNPNARLEMKSSAFH